MSHHWSNRGHLLGLENLSREDLSTLLDDARGLLAMARGDVPAGTSLAGKCVATLFFENSTRTRLSFTMAGKRLGADVLDLNASTSSSSKGESLLDTAMNVQAMGVDGLVIRCNASGGPQLVAEGVALLLREPLNLPQCQRRHEERALLRLGRHRHERVDAA